jgi:hypothetical protein
MQGSSLLSHERNGMPWLYKHLVEDHVWCRGSEARNGTECRGAVTGKKEKRKKKYETGGNVGKFLCFVTI